MLWTTWGLDWRAHATGRTVAANVQRTFHPGATVLLHDSDITSVPGVLAIDRGRLAPHGGGVDARRVEGRYLERAWCRTMTRRYPTGRPGIIAAATCDRRGPGRHGLRSQQLRGAGTPRSSG